MRDKSLKALPRCVDRRPSLISLRGSQSKDLLKKLRLRLVFSSQILESQSGLQNKLKIKNQPQFLESILKIISRK